jgi:ABC-type transport system involved in multi-copper enzyme maturation permease subunit
MVQLLLIIFISPAFTATTINGEKERQTFDLLLCSNLSSVALISGKLLAGLINTLLLIAASIPLFSLIFFFGGISPYQIFEALAIFLATALFTATLGIFCSTLWKRPSTSTAFTYALTLVWLGLPLIISVLVPQIGAINASSSASGAPQPPYLLLWSPIEALLSTFGSTGLNLGNYQLGPLSLSLWQTNISLDLCATIILLILSIWLVKPGPWTRLRRKLQRKKRVDENETTITVSA